LVVFADGRTKKDQPCDADPGDQVERNRRLQTADEQVQDGGALRVDLAKQQPGVDEQDGADDHEPTSEDISCRSPPAGAGR